MADTIRMNGKTVALEAATVAALLAQAGIDPLCRFLAVAVNGTVVRRAAWATTSLAAGDDIEIVRPVSGG